MRLFTESCTYATAILLTSYGIEFFASVIFAIIFSSIMALLIGLILSKFDDDYYALKIFRF